MFAFDSRVNPKVRLDVIGDAPTVNEITGADRRTGTTRVFQAVFLIVIIILFQIFAVPPILGFGWGERHRH